MLRKQIAFLFAFIALVLITALPVQAAINGFTAGMLTVCGSEATVSFVHDNSVGMYDFFDWEAYVDGILVGKGFLIGGGDASNAPATTTVTVTLNRVINYGETVEFIVVADTVVDTETFNFTVTCNPPAIITLPSNPNLCTIDGRLDPNCGAPVVVYTHVYGDSCYIDIYTVYGHPDSRGRFVMQVTPQDVSDVSENPTENTLIESTTYPRLGTVALYRLTTGEFQLNVGLTDRGEMYVLNFTGCPARSVYTSNSYSLYER